MARLVEFDDGAHDDFNDSFNWYAARSSGAALGFISEVDAAIENIVADPGRFTKTHAGCRYLRLRRYPFSVVYYAVSGEMPGEHKIYIVAIAHHRRRPGYWRSRLERS